MVQFRILTWTPDKMRNWCSVQA